MLYGIAAIASQKFSKYGDAIESLAEERLECEKQLSRVSTSDSMTGYYLKDMIDNSATLEKLSISQSRIIITSGFFIFILALICFISCLRNKKEMKK